MSVTVTVSVVDVDFMADLDILRVLLDNQMLVNRGLIHWCLMNCVCLFCWCLWPDVWAAQSIIYRSSFVKSISPERLMIYTIVD
jgi:hypothetical protein